MLFIYSEDFEEENYYFATQIKASNGNQDNGWC